MNSLIGKNLKRLRESRGLSQAQLAERIETTPQRLSSYEVGRDGMGKEYMERVCRALNVSPWEFFVDADTPVIVSAYEKQVLDLARRAQAEGVAEEIMDYAIYRISKGAPGDKAASGSLGGKRKIVEDLYKMAMKQGKAGSLDEGIAKAIVRKGAPRARRKKKAS